MCGAPRLPFPGCLPSNPPLCPVQCNGVDINAAVQCSGDPAGQAECQQRCQSAAEESRCRWCNATEWAPVCALDGSVVPNPCLAKVKRGGCVRVRVCACAWC